MLQGMCDPSCSGEPSDKRVSYTGNRMTIQQVLPAETTCPDCGTLVDAPSVCPGCGLAIACGIEADWCRYKNIILPDTDPDPRDWVRRRKPRSKDEIVPFEEKDEAR